MGIAKTHRAKITVGDRLFLWYVSEEENGSSWGPILFVASDDKRFAVLYALDQVEPSYLVVMGQEFPGLSSTRHHWVRVRCPKFGEEPAVTPSFVCGLVEWCLDPEKPVVRVDWRGVPIA